MSSFFGGPSGGFEDGCLMKLSPFTPLKYVEGLKYTFGNKFLGRQRQGEFVFLEFEGNNKESTEGRNYFELECKDGDFWISVEVEASSPSVHVSLNGSPIIVSPKEEGDSVETRGSKSRKVKFGDLITMSVLDGGGRGQFLDFVFRSPGSHQSIIQTEEKLEEEGPVFDNPLILQNILAFLPTLNVGSLRLVSQTWNREAIGILRERDVTVWFFKPGSDQSMNQAMAMMPNSLIKPDFNATTKYLAQIPAYAHSFLNASQFGNWKLGFPRYANGDPSLNELKEAKVLDDLLWFMGPQFQPNVVTSLHLSGGLGSLSTLHTVKALLSGLKTTLRTLKFDYLIGHLRFPLDEPFQVEEMPTLKNLSFWMQSRAAFDDNDTKYFVKGILNAVGSIQSLTLTKEEGNYCQGDPFHTPFVKLVCEEIGRMQKSESKFNALNKLGIGHSENRQLSSFSTLSPNTLKELEVRDIPLQHPGPSPELAGGLSAHSMSLVELTLYFTLKYGDHWLRLPERMQELKSLRICCTVYEQYSSAPETRLRFKFGSTRTDVVDWSSRFPALENLAIWPVCGNYGGGMTPFVKRCEGTTWKDFRPVLEGFLQVQCSSLTIELDLEVPYRLSGMYDRILDGVERTFPNVEFPPELDEARRGPVYEVAAELVD